MLEAAVFPGWVRRLAAGWDQFRLPTATRLILSFLLVILLVSVVFMAVGIRLIEDRIVSEAQEKVRHDLNSAREIYLGQLRHISDVVRFTADRTLLLDELLNGDASYAAARLRQVQAREGLDVLTLTDRDGIVLLRTSGSGQIGDDQSGDDLVRRVLEGRLPVAATMIVPAGVLQQESPALAAQAYLRLIDTPMARTRPDTEQADGMMLRAAAPILDDQGQLVGVVYGGVLLNRNFQIVDKVKQTVYEDITYEGQDIGTATIFQDDVRISTNVRNTDASRALGTRVAEDVYNQVVVDGRPWIGRAYVVNNWYITAYEPIRDAGGRAIGILYVGILEQKYVDLQRETTLAFLGISLAGGLISMALAYFLSRRISVPIRKLASASREIAGGNLDARVEVRSHDELADLANAFNYMASALQERDARLKEFATRKVMESERLALVGQLAANVAHELNNPMQGIVTYSHLLLERLPDDGPTAESVRKIAAQADRCRGIIRGLLDFSRQRRPEKTACSLNAVLKESLSLIGRQALLQNIQIVEVLGEDLPPLTIDPMQIERVFMNMIINAAEAMESGGQLTLTTRLGAGGQCVEVEIRDSGHGIPPENLDAIFDPFFTTKDIGHGTGLGLAISYGIVKEHRGEILVESQVGAGTTFVIRLPLAAEAEA